MPGRSLRVFLPDGSPSGLRIAELGLSTIKCVVAPRAMLAELAKREESHKTGVYFLTGPDPDSSTGTSVYVGESDVVLTRLKEHNKDDAKSFWDTAYVFVSKDDGLTKAHVRWLEARSLEDLGLAKRATVVNSANPVGGTLPEADLAEMAEFLEQIKLLLPALGFTGFEPAAAGLLMSAPQHPPSQFHFSGNGYSATGFLLDGNFVVLAGAQVRLQTAPTIPGSSLGVRQALAKNGVLDSHPEYLRLSQDYAFNSASQAAEVVCGFSMNGRVAWKTSAGQTLGQWQDALLEAEVGVVEEDG